MSWNGNDLFNSTLMGGMPSGADPHQYLTTDGNGKPHWEGKLAYEDVQVFPVLNDATIDIKWAQAFPTYGLEWPNDVAVGDKGVMYINGVAYDYTAAQGQYGPDSIEFVPDDASASCPEITKAKMPNGATVLMLYSTVTGITITISITKVVKTLKTLDPKYLPSGSGGGGVMYIEGTESLIVPAYADDALTTMLSYDQAKEIIQKPFAVCMNIEGMRGVLYPVMAIGDDSQKKVNIVIITPEAGSAAGMTLTFSDTTA